MSRRISQVALLVREYDEAIEFFTRALRFELLEDSPLGDGKRWRPTTSRPIMRT